jgi:hypothetical protein
LPFLTTYSAADSRALIEQDYSCGEDAATSPPPRALPKAIIQTREEM